MGGFQIAISWYGGYVFHIFPLKQTSTPVVCLAHGVWQYMANHGNTNKICAGIHDWYILVRCWLIFPIYIYIYITHDIYIILYIYMYIYVKYLYIEIFIISIYTCVCLITILSHVSHWNCHLAFLALKVADDDSFVSVSNALDLTCLVGTCVLIGGGQNQNRKMVVYSSKNGDIMGFHGIFHGDWWLNNNLWWFNGRPVCELKKNTISSVNHHVHLQTGHGFHFFSC